MSFSENGTDHALGKGNRFKLTWKFLFQFYDAYSRTKNLTKVAATLGITNAVLEARIVRFNPLKIACEVADSYRPLQSLSGYVFSQLSEQAQATWKEISATKSWEEVDAIFSRRTKRIRQELFVYALANSSYDLSSACRMVGIRRDQLAKWRHDLGFMQLLEEIKWHKKNFFESALVQLVEERHPGAVMFVNRTLNADRGYSEKLQVEHTGAIQNEIDWNTLELDPETKRKVLEAIRKQRNKEPKRIKDVQVEITEKATEVSQEVRA